MNFKSTLKLLNFWIKNARYQSFAQSFIPALIALVFVANKGDGAVWLGVLAVLGVLLAHSGANLFDDYFDYRSESVKKRREMLDGGIRARSMKCAYIESGQATLKQLFIVATLFCLSAICAGAVVFYYRGLPVFICFCIGAILAFFYSAPPLRLSYRGFGELVVGLLFGPTVMTGVSYATCGRFDFGALILSIPLGILAANILYVHSIMDFEPDMRAGKRTLVALVGSAKNAIRVCGLFLFVGYASIVCGVFFGALNPWTLLVFVSAPLAFELYRDMKLYVEQPEKKLERKIWHGPMECWDMICKAKIDWFMFRWYLSRNLMSAFALCLLTGLCVGRLM